MQHVLLVIALVLFAAYAALIIYYWYGWITAKEYQPSLQTPTVLISVLIPARNEAKNISACLQSLLKQTYPKHLYEIIVVDDFSEDETAAVVKGFSAIRLLQLKDFVPGKINSYKKKAIEVGISQAKGELIVTTDADCTAPANWLQTIAAFYAEKKPSLLVMPVAINCNNRFIELFQALDFMTLQGITGAAVNKKALSMCNGANLAYTKKAFQDVDGFADIDNIASGDDMLLMHKIFKQNKNSVQYLKSKEVIVQTEPVHTVIDFLSQRIRWASKADKYDDKRILPVLAIVYLFNCLLLIAPLITLFYNFQCSIFNIHYSLLQMWVTLLTAKTIVELIFLIPVAKFFRQQKLLWFFPLLQPFHILYTVIAGWLGKFGSYQWKGRRVK
jgi:cellulose synthase/poly-beta-1,6-N-acetylglucosamine synthase-like glycosyltransferase